MSFALVIIAVRPSRCSGKLGGYEKFLEAGLVGWTFLLCRESELKGLGSFSVKKEQSIAIFILELDSSTSECDVTRGNGYQADKHSNGCPETFAKCGEN